MGQKMAKMSQNMAKNMKIIVFLSPKPHPNLEGGDENDVFD